MEEGLVADMVVVSGGILSADTLVLVGSMAVLEAVTLEVSNIMGSVGLAFLQVRLFTGPTIPTLMVTIQTITIRVIIHHPT